MNRVTDAEGILERSGTCSRAYLCIAALHSGKYTNVTIVKPIICDGSTAGLVLNMHTTGVDAWMYQFSSAWQRSLAHCSRHLPVRPMYTLELSTQRMDYTQFLCTLLLGLDHLRAPASGGGCFSPFARDSALADEARRVAIASQSICDRFSFSVFSTPEEDKLSALVIRVSLTITTLCAVPWWDLKDRY